MFNLHNFSVGWKGVSIVLVMLVSQVAIVVLAYKIIDESQTETLREIHARRVLVRISVLDGVIPLMVSQAKDYLLNGDKLTKHRCREEIDHTNEVWRELRGEFESEEGAQAQNKQLEQSEKLLANAIGMIENGLRAEDENDRTIALQQLDEKKIGVLQSTFASSLNSLADKQTETLNGNPDRWRQDRDNLLRTVTLVIAVGALASTALAMVLMNFGITKRLRVVADNALRLASNAPLSDRLTGTDEIAVLDSEFRRMAQALLSARDRERAVITNALDVICSLDTEKKFLSVNPSATRVWGYAEDELIGLRLAQIIHPDDIEATQNILKALMDGEATKPFENRVRRKDGGFAYMLWSVQYSPKDQSIFCVAHDVSERKSLEQLKEDFVAMISHDLRTPLTAIQMTLQLAGKGMYGQLNDNGLKRVTMAGDSSERLLNLINQLLDVQKLESGKMEVSPEDVALEDIFAKALDAVRVFAEQHKVNIVAKPTTLHALADSERIIQVLINLVSNAVKFSPEGGTVTISGEDDYEEIVVVIEDQGRGVPEHLQATIFERFKQVERADEKDKGGTGLGLAICKLLVDAHGGSIGVVSEEGKGSSFWFRLPKIIVAVNAVSESDA